MSRQPHRIERPKRKLRVLLLILSAVIIGLAMLGIAMYDPSPVGYWRSAEGQRTYTKTYDKAMKLLPAPSKTLDISTDFGVVRVYEWRTEQTQLATPIVLVPGRSAGVPMWVNNLPDFVAKRPVYAMDALGDAGMSTQTVRIKDGTDQATWLHQVLMNLTLTKAHIVGHSFGGWAAANYATQHPERVASLVLLEPVCVFQGLDIQLIVKTIPAAIPFLPKSWRESMLKDIGGVTELDLTDPIARMIAEGTEHYAQKLPGLPEQITPQQMQAWKMPVYAAMAGKSIMHDSEKAVAVARSSIRHIQIKNWSGATHSLPMEFPREINAEVLSFTDTSDTYR
jgi:pimeloyl-ACP methyl ester carboxylesterase